MPGTWSQKVGASACAISVRAGRLRRDSARDRLRPNFPSSEPHELAVLLLEESCQVGAPNHNRLYPRPGQAPLHLVVTRLNLTTPAGVRQLVELHGGTISVESRENAGSTFIMRLPLVAGTEPVVTEAPGGPPGRAAATA